MTTWSPHDKNTEYIAFFFNFTQTIFKTTWRDFYVSLSLFFSFTGDFYFYFIFSLFLSFLRLFYNNRQSICWGIGWHCLTTHTQTCNYTHGEREEDRMTNATSIVIFLHTVVSRSRLSGNKLTHTETYTHTDTDLRSRTHMRYYVHLLVCLPIYSCIYKHQHKYYTNTFFKELDEDSVSVHQTIWICARDQVWVPGAIPG